MTQKANNIPAVPPFPSSPADSSFIPRKEFAPQPPWEYSSFALLAFSSNNAIRLSNFPQSFVTELRARLHAVVGLRSFRENAEHTLCEIILVGKPWSSPKALSTEVVLVQVFSVLFSYGFSFVSQMDYGRRYNDRVSLVFSRPATSSNSDGPIPAQSNIPRLAPFGLSFCSSNILKVVCAPLQTTPAILQCIRGAWPRGVSSERKVGENCYEFELKGYPWFHEDTFAEDSLTHMLTILTALDKHSWKLVTSISLSTSHTRYKDFWIFSGPHTTLSANPPLRPYSPINLGSPLKPIMDEPIIDNPRDRLEDSDISHPGLNSQMQETRHVRGATENNGKIHGLLNKSHNVHSGHRKSLSEGIPIIKRKPPPKRSLEEERQIHTRPVALEESTPLQSPPGITAVVEHETSIRPKVPYPQTNAEVEMHSEVSTEVRREPLLYDIPVGSPNSTMPHTPPLLAPNTFRPIPGTDSYRETTLSDESGQTFDVPIRWVPHREDGDVFQDGHTDMILDQTSSSAFPEDVQDNRLTDFTDTTETPILPGGWVSTPSEDLKDPILSVSTPRSTTPHLGTPAHKEPRRDAIVCHSPQIVEVGLPGNKDHSIRKSEKVIIDTVNPTHAQEAVNEPVDNVTGHCEESSPVDRNKPVPESWVLVSVTPQSATAVVEATQTSEHKDVSQFSSTSGETQVPPAAVRTIAVVDKAAPEFPAPSPPPDTHTDKNRAGSSVLSRLLSHRGTHKAKKGLGEEEIPDKKIGQDKAESAGKQKGGRLKTSNGVLPTIRSGKRLSIH